MKLLIVGCDYTGKTSLAKKVVEWMHANLGSRYAMDVAVGAHDHFTFPNPELPPEERSKLPLLGPMAREQYQRYMIAYHLGSAFWKEDNDLVLVGFHFTEAVYTPLYYGYGQPGAFAARSGEARVIETHIMESDSRTVMVYLRSRADVIRKRMRERPNPDSPLLEGDVERVLEAFEVEFNSTFIRRRFAIDTSDLSVDETFDRWLKTMDSYFSETDWLRILGHTARV
jgi:broad-specificity NMP kinase